MNPVSAIRILSIAGILVVALALAGCGTDNSGSASPTQPNMDAFGVPDGFSSVITPDSNENCTASAATCWRYSVVVPKGLSKTALEQNMRYCVEQAYHDHQAVRGVVNAYAAGTDLNGTYSAANVEWGNFGGDDDPQADEDTVAKTIHVEYCDDYFKSEVAAPKVIHGRSEAERKKIAYEIALAEDRATHEADVAFPTTSDDTSASMAQASRNVRPNADLNNKLEERYHDRIKKRYHLSSKDFTNIIGEAGEKHWPTPDSTKD